MSLLLNPTNYNFFDNVVIDLGEKSDGKDSFATPEIEWITERC